jgi:hypothetical protein
MYICVIFDLQLYVDCTELKNGAGQTARGCMWGVSCNNRGEKRVSNISRLEAWDLDRRIFMSAPFYSYYPSRSLVIGSKPYSFIYLHTSCKALTIYFSLQVKVKQMVELSFLHLFLELVWSRTLTKYFLGLQDYHLFFSWHLTYE